MRWGDEGQYVIIPLFHSFLITPLPWSSLDSPHEYQFPQYLCPVHWTDCIISTPIPSSFSSSDLGVPSLVPQSFVTFSSSLWPGILLFSQAFSQRHYQFPCWAQLCCAKGLAQGRHCPPPTEAPSSLCSPHCQQLHAYTNTVFNTTRGQNENPMAGTQVWESTL